MSSEKLAATQPHILVTGHSGAGKSTTASQLSQQLGMPVYSIDSRPEWGDLFRGDPDDEHLVPGTDKRREFIQLRRRLAQESVSGLTQPTIVEGTQLAGLTNRELADYPNRVMVTTPLKELLRQRLERVRAKALAKGKPWNDEIAAKRQAAGRRIYDDNAKVFRRVSKVPGTVQHNSRSDVQELIAKLQLPKRAAVVSIIKGNPDADPDNAVKYEDFYNTVADIVRQQGATPKFDKGSGGTVPDGDIWLGHSRGADRLRFAPPNVKTLRLDDFEPATARAAQEANYNRLFKQYGYKSIAEVPIEMRPKPGPEHYTLSPEAKSAIVNLLQQASTKQAASPLVAAGLCVLAADTGRVLMLQRAFDDADPASGKWEFPGGHIERGETPLEAAKREWEEEVGCRLPAHLQIHVDWRSGIYVGYVGSIPSEKDLKINNKGRRVLNPDDPDQDNIEIVAWWKPKDIKGNPVIRRELARVYKDKVHWAIKLSQLQLRRLDTMQKTASTSTGSAVWGATKIAGVENFLPESRSSAEHLGAGVGAGLGGLTGAGIGAGVGALTQLLRQKKKRDYLRAMLIGGGVGAGVGGLAGGVVGTDLAGTLHTERGESRYLNDLIRDQVLNSQSGYFKGGSFDQIVRNLASTSAGSAVLGAGVGAGAGMLKQVFKPKEERDYAGGALLGAGIGAGAGYGVKQLANSDPGIESGITEKYEATRRLLRLMYQPAAERKLGGISKTAEKGGVVLFDSSAAPPSIESLRQAGNGSKAPLIGAGLGAIGGGTVGAMGGAVLGSGIGMIREMLRKRKEERSLTRGLLAGGGIGAGVGAGIGGVAGGAKGIQVAGAYQSAMRNAADTLEQAELKGSPIKTVEELMQLLRKSQKQSQWGDRDVIDHLCELTSKQASRLSAKLAVRAMLQKAGADAVEIVMNQRAVHAKAAGILDNIKATLADPSTRPYATALIGSGLGAVGGAAKSLLMDDPEDRSVLRSALMGAGIGGIGGGIYGKFSKDGPAVVDPNAPPQITNVSRKDKVLQHPATAVIGGGVGAGLGAVGGARGTSWAGKATEAIGNRMQAGGGGVVSKAISGAGRGMRHRVGRGMGAAGAALGGAYLANLLRNSMMNKSSGFASLGGPLGKGYTDRVTALANPPKEPKQSKAPVAAPPGPMILNPNGTPVGTQSPASLTGAGGMPAPPTMPKVAAGGDVLKWISDKWADPTNRAMMGAAGGAAAGSLGMLGAEALSPDKKRRRYLNAALTGALGGAAVGGGLGQLSNLSSGGVPDRDLSEVEANILKTPGGVKSLDKAVQKQTPGPVQRAGQLVGEVYNESPLIASAGVGAAAHFGTRNNPLLQNFVNRGELAHDAQMVELRRLFAAAQAGGGVTHVGGEARTLSQIGDLITARTRDIHAGTGNMHFAAGRGMRKSLPGLIAGGLAAAPAVYNWMRGE